MELTTMEEAEKWIEKREQENEKKNEKSPLGEEKMRNESNVENVSNPSRFKIFERCSVDPLNHSNTKLVNNVCTSNQVSEINSLQGDLTSSAESANR